MYGTASLSEIHVQDNNNNFAFYLMKVLLMQIQQYSLPVALQWSSIYTDDMIQRRCGMHLSTHAHTNLRKLNILFTIRH